jgi:hypothetical protein
MVEKTAFATPERTCTFNDFSTKPLKAKVYLTIHARNIETDGKNDAWYLCKKAKFVHVGTGADEDGISALGTLDF